MAHQGRGSIHREASSIGSAGVPYAAWGTAFLYSNMFKPAAVSKKILTITDDLKKCDE